MHEMSLCESIMQIVEDQARASGAAAVKRVRVEIGRFAGVEPEALRFSFEVVTAGTIASGAALEIIDTPGRAWCFDCGVTVDLETRGDVCPACNGARLLAVGGQELRVKDMEVV